MKCWCNQGHADSHAEYLARMRAWGRNYRLGWTEQKRAAKRQRQRKWEEKNSEHLRTWHRQWEQANRPQVRDRHRRWRRANRHDCNQKRRRYRAANGDKFRKLSRERAALDRARLADDYVLRTLYVYGATRKAVPRALIEAKRAQLRIHRLVRSTAT